MAPPGSSLHEVAEFLAAVATLTLTQEQADAVAAMYATLPDNATLRDFINACDAKAAAELGIPMSRLEAIRPLLPALEAAAQPGRYGHLFDTAQ